MDEKNKIGHGHEEERRERKDDTPDLPGPVTVIVGGHPPRTFNIAGAKVKDVRKKLKTILNIADEAVAIVNTTKVNEETALKEGDVLEFVREAGAKG